MKPIHLLSISIAFSLAVNTVLAADDAPDYHPFTLSLDAGTTGAGGSAGWRFMDHFGARVGVDYFKYTRTDDIEGVTYDATVKLVTEPLTLDIYPWKSRSFHISVGAAFNQNELNGTGVSTSGTFELNGVTFPAAAVGSLNLNVKQQPVNPYISIGGNLLYFDNAHRWSLAGEAGVFYTGDAKVSLTRLGGIPSAAIDAAVLGEQQSIKDEVNKFQFWPVLKLSLNFSF